MKKRKWFEADSGIAQAPPAIRRNGQPCASWAQPSLRCMNHVAVVMPGMNFPTTRDPRRIPHASGVTAARHGRCPPFEAAPQALANANSAAPHNDTKGPTILCSRPRDRNRLPAERGWRSRAYCELGDWRNAGSGRRNPSTGRRSGCEDGNQQPSTTFRPAVDECMPMEQARSTAQRPSNGVGRAAGHRQEPDQCDRHDQCHPTTSGARPRASSMKEPRSLLGAADISTHRQVKQEDPKPGRVLGFDDPSAPSGNACRWRITHSPRLRVLPPDALKKQEGSRRARASPAIAATTGTAALARSVSWPMVKAHS